MAILRGYANGTFARVSIISKSIGRAKLTSGAPPVEGPVVVVANGFEEVDVVIGLIGVVFVVGLGEVEVEVVVGLVEVEVVVGLVEVEVVVGLVEVEVVDDLVDVVVVLGGMPVPVRKRA